jgi:two-component system sensor histidine kinase KdpD
VDRNLDDYVRRKKLGAHWAVSEKVAVCISSSAQARDLIARGARLAEALDAELYVLHVSTPRDQEPDRKRTLESSIQFAKNLGAMVVPLTGSDTARVTAAFIRENRITQAMVGRTALHGLRKYLYYMAIQKFMSEAPHVDLHIVTQEVH